jgi:hypothetical protein
LISWLPICVSAQLPTCPLARRARLLAALPRKERSITLTPTEYTVLAYVIDVTYGSKPSTANADGSTRRVGRQRSHLSAAQSSANAAAVGIAYLLYRVARQTRLHSQKGTNSPKPPVSRFLVRSFWRPLWKFFPAVLAFKFNALRCNRQSRNSYHRRSLDAAKSIARPDRNDGIISKDS